MHWSLGATISSVPGIDVGDDWVSASETPGTWVPLDAAPAPAVAVPAVAVPHRGGTTLGT